MRETDSRCWVCWCSSASRTAGIRPGRPRGGAKGDSHNLQGPFMVFRDAVQEELKLTDEQKEKLEEHLRELLPEAMQFFQSLDGLDGEEREKNSKPSGRRRGRNWPWC